MSFRFGDIVFDFEQDFSEGCICFYEWLGDSWGVLFFYFVDFILVCIIELGFIVKFKDQFVQCGVKVLVLLVDLVELYLKWIDDINEIQDIWVNFLIIVDVDCKVFEFYDLIYLNVNDMLIVCLLFIIDLNKKVCLIIIYLVSIGCNFNEIFWVIDLL